MLNNVIYFNSEGKRVEDLGIQQQEACLETISYCTSAIVPDGFTFSFTSFDNFTACSDLSQLVCMLEDEEVEATVEDPCGGTLTCPITLNAVRLVGTARFHINVGDLTPIEGGLQLGDLPCTLSSDTAVSVNQVIRTICQRDICQDKCFRTIGAFAFAPQVTTDACGRQIVTVRGGLFIGFTGC
ncbi:hypothetical protein E2R51_15100 [Jeotgalibacillus sp. S-D1]|uniref:hypothetical protein n=1 Tax=Jeotgalibacillus sp. S-D1 TaxID=2552189 RepID=UPI0010598EE5|nr:hypothetical protein [Jeotgalibacillus sp. S-D1]TDL31116.1 hypothetical protein E2R51_15100 [Jeotgalibacillus sp. S-D1]